MNKTNALLRPFNVRAVVFALFSLALLYVIPVIDKALNPSSDSPGMFTFVGVALTLTLLTAFTLYFGLKSNFGLPRKFFLFAILYNVCFIVVKFSLALAITYNQASNRGDGGLVDFRVAAPVIAAIVFALYLGVFLIVMDVNRSYVKNVPGPEGTQARTETGNRKTGSRVGGFLISALAGLVMFVVVGFILLIVAFFTGALDYFLTVLFSPPGVVVALLLLATLLFLQLAFSTVTKRATVVRDMAIFMSFVWIGIAFLVAFHALWIVFVLIVASIWPLQLLVPK
jgi:hypothetical protein